MIVEAMSMTKASEAEGKGERNPITEIVIRHDDDDDDDDDDDNNYGNRARY